MNTYLGLFRGINVGGKHILPMNELVSILDALGYKNIQTYIQSGNVVFKSKKIVDEKSANQISKRILNAKGFEPAILLFSAAQLQEVVNNNPFPTNDGKALHFFFLLSPPQQINTEKLKALKADSEEFRLINNVFYLYAPNGIGRSKLAAGAEKILRVPATARNWNTVNKLMTMTNS